MNPPTRRPLFGLPAQAGDGHAGPMLEIDAVAATILGANDAGWRAWGVDPAAVAPPLAIDRAIPALERLRAVAAGRESTSQESERLTFWTARGLLELDCRIEAQEDGACFVVRADEPQPAGEIAEPACKAADDGPPRDIALPARLAHELRTPLSAVIAYAEVLKNEHFGPLSNARYLTYARDIYQSARHALGVVDAMLGDPKEAGARELVFTDLEPAVVAEGCVAVARPLAEGAGLALEANYAPGLPRVIADEVSLRQMLLNLLTNAIKFARRGDRVTVAVDCRENGPLHIAIADTGPGMDPEARRNGDDRNPPGHGRKGLGLGLPLTRGLAAANGATLTIDSAPGRGTRATISFGKDRLVPV